MRRFEFVEGNSAKFWEIEVDGASVTVRFGKIGSAGQAKTTAHPSAAAAKKAADALIKEKNGKGYAEVASAKKAAPAKAAPAKKVAPAKKAASADPPDLVALRKLGDDAFFGDPTYGELTLSDGEPDGAHHYRSTPDGAAWGALFDEIRWIGEEADGGLVGYIRDAKGALDHVVMLDNEGSLHSTGRTFVDHLAFRAEYEGDEEHEELLAFCTKAGLPKPRTGAAREKSLKGAVDPEARLAAHRAAAAKSDPAATKGPAVRPVDRHPIGCALPDGRLLVVSSDDDVSEHGYDGNAVFVFDPRTLRFARAAETPLKMYITAACVGALPDGRAAFVKYGAEECVVLLYDPAKDAWTRGAVLESDHDWGAAALTADGRVVLAGGGSLGRSDEVDVYDPAEDAWSSHGTLSKARNNPALARLADGRLLAAGGTNDDYADVADCDLYDPRKDAWTKAAKLPVKLSNLQLVALGDGRVLGVSNSERAVFDPKAGAWKKLPDEQLSSGRSVVIGDGRVATFGWKGVGITDPKTLKATSGGAMALARSGDVLPFVLPDGRVLLIGGDLFHNIACEPEIWDPRTGTGSALPGLEKELDKQVKDLAKHHAKSR